MSVAGNDRVVRTWYHWPGQGCRAEHAIASAPISREPAYDVAIIGAGVIGCALAYELSQYHLRTIVLEKAYDVGEGTSKGNSAIVHTGFDATPGSLESQLVTQASRQWPDLAQKLKIPFAPISALMLAFNDEQRKQLPKLEQKARDNGVDDIRLVTASEVRELEPHVSPQVLGGLLIPRESIADPFMTTIAYAEVAQNNGVDFAFGVDVVRVDNADEPTKSIILSNPMRLAARYVINAAGFGARKLVESYGGELMDLNPRRGQFVIYDRACRSLVQRILLPIPTEQTKGMLITPTIFGNLVAGPTAEDLPPDHVDATNTTFEGIAAVRNSGIQMCPELAHQPIIATYAGLRCHCAQGSYWMRFNDGHHGIVTLAGIRSTGFTASITTARHVIATMERECGLTLERNRDATDRRPESQWPGWWRRPYEDRARIAARPDYGQIVCYCENISRGEIQDALDSSPAAMTLDGLKRRTRVLTGRCQGFNCCVPIAEMIANHYQCPLSAVTKKGPGTTFIANTQPATRGATRAARDTLREFQTHYRAIIVGAGPAGIGVAVGLARRGVGNVLLLDRASEIGGIPSKYPSKKAGAIPTFIVWKRGRVMHGQSFVELLAQELVKTTTQVELESQVIQACHTSRSLTVVNRRGVAQLHADAIIFACGARERTPSERTWLVGHRPARLFYTMQILQLLAGYGAVPSRRPAIVGSDLIAYSAAAKLSASGASDIVLTDHTDRPAARWWEQFYFRRWTHPQWRSSPQGFTIPSATAQQDFLLEFGGAPMARDGIVICGDLIPNSELAVLAGLDVRQPDRIPLVTGSHQLSAPGWFIAGAERGGFLGAASCYEDGQRAALHVANYLERLPSWSA